jgi:hypothetical protein
MLEQPAKRERASAVVPILKMREVFMCVTLGRGLFNDLNADIPHVSLAEDLLAWCMSSEYRVIGDLRPQFFGLVGGMVLPPTAK